MAKRQFARNLGNYFTYLVEEVTDNTNPLRDPKDTLAEAAGAQID